MKVVYKYELVVGHVIKLALPPGSETLCVKIQRNTICLWVLQDTNPPVVKQTRNFMVVGTGTFFDSPIKNYIGTVMTGDHNYVFHVFEVF